MDVNRKIESQRSLGHTFPYSLPMNNLNLIMDVTRKII